MIISINDFKELSDICKSLGINDAAAVKIKSLALAYGFGYSFCLFWQQIINGSVTAVVCKYYFSVTVISCENTDVYELTKFLNAIGYSELLSKQMPQIVAKNVETVYAVLKNSTKVQRFETPYYNDYKAAYDMLIKTESDAVTLGGFDEWYADISHRVRHDAAFLHLEENSCAIWLFDGKNYLLNGIALKNGFNGKGVGKTTVLKHTVDSPKPHLHAFCFRNELGFYKKCGFAVADEYCYYKIF